MLDKLDNKKVLIMNTKKILGTALIALLGGVVAVFAYTRFFDPGTKIVTAETVQPISFANLPGGGFDASSLDFTVAAENTVHAVVHVKTQSTRNSYYRNPIYEFFYGEKYQADPEPVIGFGSGVIMSEDGYIVTNNHVIDNSDKVYVTLNDNREFEAKLIGADPSTDLAVLKIDAENIHHLKWGNSDNLKLGEWVLAVGNPFNLTSTVTAGIISAKGRNLNIIQDRYRIESFIQTDAALNRGNSGGALVNLKSELVGINTAILSPSGGYSGNSFAVPVSIVQKVVEDLIEYGTVQRALLGVSIRDVNSELIDEEKLKLDEIKGVFVESLSENGAAEDAGIERGDIITAINDIQVNNVAELQEQVSRYRPKEKITVTLLRDNKKKQFEVVLRNMQGNTNVVTADAVNSILGGTFAEISDNEKQSLGVKNGVKIKSLNSGKLKSAGIKEGFIITKINENEVHTVRDINRILGSIEGGVFIEGVYPNGEVEYYAFPK